LLKAFFAMRMASTFVLSGALLFVACSAYDDSDPVGRSGRAPSSSDSAEGSPAANDDAANAPSDAPASPTTGTSGSGASGGTTGATVPPDAGAPPPPALAECTGAPSLDRLQKWLASGEGATVPASGSILGTENGKPIAKVQFVNAEWHVVPVWIANKFDGGQVDLTKAASFTLTYSATDDLYVQMRAASTWSGGDKYLTKIPSTGGQVVTKVFSFAPEAWTTLPELGTPPYPYAEARKEVRGLVFVGKTANVVTFRGLRIDGYTPTCS
jgi:hypothetical protein